MPDWKKLIREQLAVLNLPPAREAEIAEELAQHAEDRFCELQTGGLSEAEARRLTLEEITGNELLTTSLKTIERTVTSEAPIPVSGGKGNLFTGIAKDLSYSFRTLRNSPGFAAISIFVLALGIGANTAIFSVVNGVLLQPLAYHDPGQLLRIFESTPEFAESSVAYLNYLDWRRESHSFSEMGIFRGGDFNFTGQGEPEQLSGSYISTTLFPVLGVSPLFGRNFFPEEDRPGAACATIISYAFWQSRFGGDRNILGETLTLNAKPCKVVGVLRSNFRFGSNPPVFIPINQWSSTELDDREGHPGLSVIARLKAGVTRQQAQSEMASICQRLARQYPKSNASRSARVVDMKDDLVGYIRPTLLLLVGAVGFVLIIACANVANLMLARSAARRREFAIRVALGAERWRIVRQLLMESILLSFGAAVVGLLIARWGTTLILAAVPGTLPRSQEIGINLDVLLFTLGVSMVTAILFALAPAFMSANPNPVQALKEGSRGAGGGRHRAESFFVALEVCLAVILLVASALMIQSVWRLLRVNPGFNARNVVSMQLAMSPKVMGNSPDLRLAFHQLLDRVRSTSGIQSAALTALVPLSDNDNEIPFWIGNGVQPSSDRLTSAIFYIVTPDYANVMQVPLLRGRFLNEQDKLGTPNVVVIDDVMARHYFPIQDPIGKQISLITFRAVRIVGVVGHVKQWGLDTDDTSKIRSQVYFPVWQVPDEFLTEGAVGVTLLLRTKPEPLSLLPAIRAQVAGPGRDQPIYAVATMDEIISRSLAERRFTMLVLTLFGAVALALAAVGIYGVMSYAVTRRVHEMGIRAALGASRGQIIGLVLRQGMGLAVLGMAAGIVAAFGLSRFLSTLLYEVKPGDPMTLLAVTLLLGLIALLACFLPARRATELDPIEALRSE